MYIGQHVTETPQTLYFNLHDKSEQRIRPMPGTVVWIHPKGRFYVVEFDFGRYSVREAFRCERRKRS